MWANKMAVNGGKNVDGKLENKIVPNSVECIKWEINLTDAKKKLVARSFFYPCF